MFCSAGEDGCHNGILSIKNYSDLAESATGLLNGEEVYTQQAHIDMIILLKYLNFLFAAYLI